MNRQELELSIQSWHRARSAAETETRKADQWAALHACTLKEQPEWSLDKPAAYTPPRSVYIKQINQRIDQAVARAKKTK